MVNLDFLSQAKVLQCLAHHQGCGYFSKRNTYCFTYKRNGSWCPWVCFNNVDLFLIKFDSILNIHQSYYIKFQCKFSGVFPNYLKQVFRNGLRRYYTSGITGVDTCFFNMLHDSCYENILSITKKINIKFNSIFKEFIYKNRVFRRNLYSFLHIFLKFIGIINNFHCSSTDNIWRTYENWESNSFSSFSSLVKWVCKTIWSLVDIQFV